MEDLYNPEEQITCPYNASHYIRRCKMSVHLVKCKKNYPEQKMVPCDFNATHMVPEIELQFHHSNCSDRKKIEAEIVRPSSYSGPKFVVPKLDIPQDESWDDINVAAYDPNAYMANHDILRHMDVESEAKRKNFRMQERTRLRNLNAAERSGASEPPERFLNTSNAGRLPPHREVTEIHDVEKSSRMVDLRERLRMGANRVSSNK